MKTKEKMKIPLRYFEKLTILTPYQVNYLQEYRSRVCATNINALARIDTILGKQITPLNVNG